VEGQETFPRIQPCLLHHGPCHTWLVRRPVSGIGSFMSSLCSRIRGPEYAILILKLTVLIMAVFHYAVFIRTAESIVLTCPSRNDPTW
jgi:hypothetical protein